MLKVWKIKSRNAILVVSPRNSRCRQSSSSIPLFVAISLRCHLEHLERSLSLESSLRTVAFTVAYIEDKVFEHTKFILIKNYTKYLITLKYNYT